MNDPSALTVRVAPSGVTRVPRAPPATELTERVSPESASESLLSRFPLVARVSPLDVVSLVVTGASFSPVTVIVTVMVPIRKLRPRTVETIMRKIPRNRFFTVFPYLNKNQEISHVPFGRSRKSREKTF